MTMAQQINAAQHQGAPSRPTTTFSRNSGQGNYTPTTAQINYCDDRVVGVNRTTTSYGTYGSLINAVDRPVDGRLMYLSDPLEEDLLLSGTPVVHLNAAPTKGTGNLTVALMEIGRLPRAAVRIEGVSLSSSGATSVTVFPSENGAGSESASSYGRATSGGGTTGYPSRARVGTSVGNFKYVTWGHTDIQNPSYDGKAWFDVPEQNYTPNYYFQTTLIEPGKYYDYVVELNPYNYVFEAGTRIGVMVYGTDVMASPQLDAASVCGLDVKLGDGTYIDLPLKINEPSEPVTVEVESTLVAPSDTVEITYSVKDNAYGFAAFDFDLPFDDSIYTPLTVTPAGLLSGETVAYEIVGSSLNVNYSDIDNVVGEGALFTVTYEVLNDVNYNFDAPLNVNVNAFQYGSIIDKLVDVEVIVKAGALIPYSYRVYMEAADTILSPEDTFYVDVLVGGGLNYTQVAAEIAYDTSLFDYVGYEYLDGWVAAVSAVAPNKVSIRSMPSSNMVVGAPSWPPVKVATLKFSPKDNYEGNIATAEFGFASLFVAPAGTVKAYTTAPGKPINLTLDKNQLSKEEAAFLDLLEYDYVDDLAYRLQHEVGNRYTTSPRSALAVDWIVAELEAYGYTPEVKTFNATGTTTMDGIIWINGKHYVYYGTGTVSNSVYKYNNAAELKISGVEVIHWANQSTALTVPAGDYAGKAVFVTLDTVGTAVAATMPSATNAYNVALALQDAGAAAVMFQTPPMAASGNTTYGRLANQGSGTAITIPVGTVLNYETAPMLSSWDKDTELVLNMRLGTVCKNVIATIPSATGSKKTVYITSHHDTTTSGPGINDNGSGVVMCLGMAKALKNVKFDYNVVFVIFDSEETGGMRGATNFVNSMTAEDRANFEADYNMDMIATSQANCQWMFMNISDTRLNGISTPDVNTSLADNPVALAIAKEYDFYNKTMRAAEKMKFADHVLFAYDTTTDHIVFFRAGMTNSVEYDWRSNRRGSGFETLYHKTGDTYEMNWSLERCQIQADIISLAIFYSAKGHVLPGTVSAPGIITPPVLSPVWQPALITEVWEVEEDFEVLAEDVVDIFGEAIGEKIVIIE
ncbi:MAG: M28 family peptidase [Clostridiales bacterium]|nr:M28 family peptidase [Clostridiales bacterium]